MGIIKDVLQEELENSIKMKKNYKDMLKSLHGGSIIKKSIKGHIYYYLAYRDGNKVRFVYKGKDKPRAVSELKKIKQKRAKYKQLVKKLNNQIKYLRKALRGKEKA